MPVFLFYHQSFHHVPDRPFQLLDVADVDFLEFDEMHFQIIRQNIMGIIIRDLPGHRGKNVSHQSEAERFPYPKK